MLTVRHRVRPVLVMLGFAAAGAAALGLATDLSPAWAALPQVTNVQFQGTTLTWNTLPGSAAYNVYRGAITGLRTGNYGACLLGSVQGSSTGVPNDSVPVGTGIFYLVDGFDESGEGPIADPPAASPSLRCVPARRVLPFATDGDPGDGIADGTDPLRNPDALLYATHQESAGVLLHSGEFVLSAVDLDLVERDYARMRPGRQSPRPRVDGTQTAVIVGPGGDEIATDRHGRVKVHFHWDRLGKKDSDPSCSAGTAPTCGGGVHFSAAYFNMPHGGVWGGTRFFRENEFITYDGGGPDGSGQPYHRGLVQSGEGLLHGRRPQRPCWSCHAGSTPASSGLAGAYEVGRSYRSQVHYAGPLGRGWDFPANARLAPSGSSALYFDGAGRQALFIRLDATHFAATRGRYALLMQNGDGTFTLRDGDGSMQNFHAFDGSSRQGVLESALDRQGDRASFLYDNQGLLNDVVDPLGRTIHYAYDPQGHVTSITDYAGRQVVYGYDTGGNLVSARSPVVTGTPNGNDFPSGRTTQYQYSSGFADDRLNGNLILVMRPNEAGTGVPAVQNVYGSDAAAFNLDRVTSQTIGGTNAGGVPAGGTLTYAYQSLNPGGDPANLALARRKATVFDRNGNQKDFVHNANGNLLSLTEHTNRGLRTGEGDYTTQFSYDSDGELIQVLRPQGDKSQFVYDKPGLDRYREGNLLIVKSLPDTLAAGGRGDGHGGETNNLVWTFTYDPLFNQPASMTDARGNDPSYVPQNGGANTAARYTGVWTYDYQEGDPAQNGVNAYALRFGIDLSGIPFGLGDVNGDGTTLQAQGNVIKMADPAAHLDPASNQGGINGPLQAIQTLFEWNAHGQPTALTDAEQNRDTFAYHAETDPEGDGVQTPPPLDGRSLDATSGGMLKTAVVDAVPTLPSPGRDNGVNPGPTQIQYDMKYDGYGNLALLVDGRGVVTRYIQTALGEVVEVREAAATADASGPDGTPPTGRGETGLTAFGFIERYAYDADGNLVQTQNEDRGATRGLGPFIATQFTYDILGDLVQTDRPAAPGTTLTTHYVYDANQNLTRLTEPDGNSHDRAYDERDLLLSSTRGAAGPLGGTPSVRSFDYDGDGNLTRLTDGRGGLTDFKYDGHDRLARSVDPVGGTLDRYYDPVSDVVRLLGRGTPGGPTPPDRSGSGDVDLADTRMLYDEAARAFRADSMLFVPSGVTPFRPPAITEGPLLPADGAVNTIFEYDRLSRLTFVHKDTGALTRFDYDGAGRTMKSTDSAGDTAEFAYDADSDPVESIETQLGKTPGPIQEPFFTTAFYDALGRPTMSVDNLGGTSRRLYDSLGALVTATDANGPSGGSINRRSAGHTGMSVPINGHGNVTRFAYDGAERLLTTTQVLTSTGQGDGTTTPPPDTSNPSNPDGLITGTRAWSGDGLVLQALDDRGNATSYAYDNLDRQVHVGRSDGTVQQISMDGEDAVVAATDPNGTQTAASIDPGGRTTARTITPARGVGGTTSQAFEYDGLSRLTRAVDPNQPGPTDDTNIRFYYDSLGRLLEEAQLPAGLEGGVTLYSDLAWQAGDQMTGLTYPDGDQVMYGYDGAGRLRTMNDMMHPELMATFDWFGMDRLMQRTFGNGVRLTFLDDTGTIDTGYDGMRRPILMRHLDPSNALLAGFEYRYDREGSIVSTRRPHDCLATSGGCHGDLYAIDSAGRLLSAREAYLDANHNPVSTFSDQEAWTLDGPGNWANLTRNGTLYLNTPNNLNEYDEAQCCGTHVEDGIPDDFLDVASTPFADGLNLTYDRNGNQTNTVRQALVYNFANRPVVASDVTSGFQVAAYAYDALGRRTRRAVSGGEGPSGTTIEAYAGGLSVDAVEEDGPFGNLIVQHGVGPGGGCLWHLRGDGSTQYALEDALGSGVALVPAFAAGGGGVLERVVYDAYGKPTFEDAFNNPITLPGGGPFIAASQYDNDHLFRGMHYDPELGARGASVNTDFGGLYGGGRFYNPNEGRVMNVPPGDMVSSRPPPQNSPGDLVASKPGPWQSSGNDGSSAGPWQSSRNGWSRVGPWQSMGRGGSTAGPWQSTGDGGSVAGPWQSTWDGGSMSGPWQSTGDGGSVAGPWQTAGRRWSNTSPWQAMGSDGGMIGPWQSNTNAGSGPCQSCPH